MRNLLLCLMVLGLAGPVLADASGGAATLWALSDSADDAPTVTAAPLRGPESDQLADATASAASVAQQLVVLRQIQALRQQQAALTSLDEASGENVTVLGELQDSVAGVPVQGHYDIYGVYHPPAYGAGYEVDETRLSAGPNYFRHVTYRPVIYRPYPCYRACYSSCCRPCPPRRWCRPGLTVRATGDWGFVGYRSSTACGGASLKIRINVD